MYLDWFPNVRPGCHCKHAQTTPTMIKGKQLNTGIVLRLFSRRSLISMEEFPNVVECLLSSTQCYIGLVKL
jgi:hypothetical protein